MNRTWISRFGMIGLGVGLAAAALAAGSAQAQFSPKGGDLDISSDHFSANNPENMATYDGHVEALQGGNRMRSDVLNIYTKPKGATPKPQSTATTGDGPITSWGNIDHLEADGNVYFVTPTQVVRGDKAVWTKDTDTVVITGQVVVVQGEDVMRGTRLTYVRPTGKSTMESDTGRVRSVIHQDKKTTPGG